VPSSAIVKKEGADVRLCPHRHRPFANWRIAGSFWSVRRKGGGCYFWCGDGGMRFCAVHGRLDGCKKKSSSLNYHAFCMCAFPLEKMIHHVAFYAQKMLQFQNVRTCALYHYFQWKNGAILNIRVSSRKWFVKSLTEDTVMSMV